MPNITDEIIDAWAWCPQWACPGNYQAAVKAVRQTVEHLVGDLTGDWAKSVGYDPRFVERTVYPPMRFADEDEAPCPACGTPRELGSEKRVAYAAKSGHRQDGLKLIHRFGTVDAGVKIESALSAAKLDVITAANEKERERHQLRVDELQSIWDRGTG